MAEQLLYEIEGARLLVGIGRTKFYELIDSGDIESVRVGRRRLIPHDALVAFVERLRSEQHQGAA